MTKINKIAILSRTDICILCGKHWIDNAFINPVIATKTISDWCALYLKEIQYKSSDRHTDEYLYTHNLDMNTSRI